MPNILKARLMARSSKPEEATMRRSPRLLIPLLALMLAPWPATAENHTVRSVNNQFIPRDITIQLGDTVTWNNEGLNHNVVEINGLFRCANGCDETGGNGNPASNPWSVTVPFNSEGEFRYFCEVHGGQTGNGQVFGMAGTVTVLAPSAPGNLRLGGNTLTVSEGGGNAQLQVQRVEGSDGAASVQFSTQNGSATSPSDFTSASGVLNWADGDNAPKGISIPIIDDSSTESQEQFTVRISNPTGAGLGAPSQTSVRINDNDNVTPPPTGGPGTLRLAAEVFEGNEGDGNLLLTVERLEGTNGAVSVSLSASGGTATDGEDFDPVATTVSWASGDGTAKQVSLPVIDDNEDEGVETVNVGISAPTGGAVLGDQTTAKAAIFDNDGGDGCSEAGGQSLCLNAGDRFKVQVSFRSQQGENGRGQILPLNQDSGLFTFFDPNNAEILVKVLNTCGFANRFWVFFAATTNQEFTLSVTDTASDVVRFYNNDFGPEPAATILDTDAFATCP
jgi:plastocyanin